MIIDKRTLRGYARSRKAIQIVLVKESFEKFTQFDFSRIHFYVSFEPEIFSREHFYVYICRIVGCVSVCVCLCACGLKKYVIFRDGGQFIWGEFSGGWFSEDVVFQGAIIILVAIFLVSFSIK